MASRRTFLKLGLAAGLVLAAGGALYRSRNPSSFSRTPLDANADTVLRAIIPALLAGAIPAEGPARQAALESALKGVHLAVSGLPFHAQKEVGDLFGLLSLGLGRRLLGGLSNDWREAGVAEVSAMLQNWRNHRTQTLQTAYHALHDLVLGPWYGNPDNWAAIGYPGPMKELST
ncbi:hypothetical protein V8J88_10535 [Massilia sp. W12]|uniref:hypothetical protein n=1 Tax=Massilia sp. W12 TaxID=3126507 RepID=UPI0030CDED7D